MLYKNKTAQVIPITALHGHLWSFEQNEIGPGSIVDIPNEMLSDSDIKIAIRTGRLIPVSEKPRIRVPWCPMNGTHGMANGAAPAVSIPPCRRCGRNDLTNFSNYCPSCFACQTCDRIIKRKYKK
jgi:hypothetical protein